VSAQAADFFSIPGDELPRTVVITGASSGIGAALARQLGRRGDRIALAARREAELRQLAAEVGTSTIVLVTDVTQRSDVVALRDRALDAFGSIDVWVNNAGRGVSKNVLELTDEEVDEMMSVNLKSALYGMQAIVPHFIERRRGQIINVSSFLSRVPMATIRSAYSASKAALNSLTANLRMDLAAAHPDIHVTLVMPGLVSTDFARHAMHGTPPMSPAAAAAAGAQTADEVAAVIVKAIDQPVAEVYTNPQLAPIARRYFEDVGAFERSMAAPRP
jgi:short-subunit dehydrogenase